MVGRYNLQTPDNVPESLLPWTLQHACFTINRHLVHTDGMTNYQRRWGVQCNSPKYNSAICSFGEAALANTKPITDIKPITVTKLDIRNKEKKTECIWLGGTTNSGATMDETGIDNVLETKEPSLENNEDKIEKNTMETIIEDVQDGGNMRTT
eukprot:5030748-Amphidinium_carterae.1